MRRYLLLVSSFLLLALASRADTVITYTATSVTESLSPGFGGSFQLLGSGFERIFGGTDEAGDFPKMLQVGQPVPLTFSIPEVVLSAAINVDFGGIVQTTDTVSGSPVIVSTSSFIIPPNPNFTYTFPAQAIGELTLSPLPLCDVPIPGHPVVPPCSLSVQVLVNVPGTLTVRLFGPVPISGGFYVDEDFTGTAVPEPPPGMLSLLGAVPIGAALLRKWRKARDSHC